MLKIGQFTDTFIPVVDGVGRVVLSYAETLSRAGHQVTVCAPMYDTGYRGGYPFELVEYTAFRVPTQPQYKTGATVLDPHYRKRMRMVELDIVHTHSPFEAGREALRIARERGLPLVATFHSKYYDDFVRVTRSESIAKVLLSGIVSFYHKCDEVWAVSGSTAEVLRGYGYRGPIHVVPNGASLREAGRDNIARAEKAFALADEPLLLFVGQINWKKNLLRVLEAAAILRQEGMPFRLLLVGQGPDRDGVQAKIDALQIGDRVSLTGHITDSALLDALYARASLLVFPSLYDNAPMVVREAAVMATPSVLVEGSSAAEVIRDGENGFLCRDDSQHLSQVIARVLEHPREAARAGEGARQSIPVPWSKIMEAVTERYRFLIAGNSGVPSPKKQSRKASRRRRR